MPDANPLPSLNPLPPTATRRVPPSPLGRRKRRAGSNIGAIVLSAILAASIAGPALAVLPEEQLKDPVLEARARHLSKELRCVVCQNQTIDDSDAPLAADLRAILRERLVAGDSDEQAKAYLVQRYGDFVLLRPPINPATLFLWFGPALLLLGGAFGVWRYWRGRSVAAPAPLDAQEQARLKALLSEKS